MFHWKYNCLVYSLKRLHYVENINVYEEINNFKVSRFNDNETGHQIRKLVLKVRYVLKKTFIFLPIQKLFLSKKTVHFLKQIAPCRILQYSTCLERSDPNLPINK